MTTTILLVEDDDTLRNCLSRALRLEGYQVEGAISAEEAIHRLSIRTFDLVLTDYLLGPRRTGLCILGHLKRFRSTTPVILMSGCKPDCLRRVAKKTGAFAFVEKPFLLHRFIELCREALKTRQVSIDRITGGRDRQTLGRYT